MTPEAIEEAARLLWQNWDAETMLEELPDDYRPVSERDGHAIQAAFPVVSGQAHVGWKIAATSNASQAHFNVEGPLAGRLLSGRILQDGSECSLATNSMGVMEAEFAFRFGEHVPPRVKAYSAVEVLSRVAEFCLTIEVPDSRYSDFTSVGMAQLLADNACAWWLLQGLPVESNWREVDLREHRVTVFRNGELVVEGCGANVLGDPREALVWLVNDVGSRGVSIGAGELVTTGSCVVPVTVRSGDHVIADFGFFGRVEARFS